jgi:membrane protein DedA with SNARE-associated domain/membrane-associated phospholipid phosphatase
MFDWLINIVGSIGSWGYIVLFIVAFLESSAFLGMLVPGETLVVIAGFLSVQGYLDIKSCAIVICLGAILGDSVGYTLGRVLGRGYFERHGRLLFLKKKHVEKAEQYFRKHGGKTVFLGKFIGFLRSFGPFTAGMSRMPYREFVVYNISACIAWAVGFSLLGYFFGLSWKAIEKWSGRVGVFIFFILLIIAGFSSIYALVVKKQVELKSWFQDKWNNLSESSWIKRFIAKNERPIIFLRKRLSPEGYLGLHLTIGLLLSAICVWIFGKITDDVVEGEPLVSIDQWVLNHVLYFRTPSLTQIMIFFTQFGEWITITIASIAIVIFLIVKKLYGAIIGYIIAVAGGGALDYILKLAIHRTRPIGDTTLIDVGGFSFPSGHAMLSMVFYGMVSYFIIRQIRQWRFRLLVVVAMGFVIFLIGFTRIYLQVHYLSDVIAGFTSGLFWLTICVTGLEIYRKRKLHLMSKN